MIENIKLCEDGSSEGRAYFPLFDKNIVVYINKGVSLEYAHSCVKALENVSESVIDDLCLSAIAYCTEFCEDIGEDIPIFEQPRDVLKMIEPNVLIISKPEDDQTPMIHMEGNCDWEIEHGIEFVIRNNELLYLAEFSSVNPWANPDKFNNEFNYAYRIKVKQ